MRSYSRFILPAAFFFVFCTYFASGNAHAQSAAATGTPAATPAAAPSTSAGATPPASPAASTPAPAQPTACSASFGIFGPINAAASTTAASAAPATSGGPAGGVSQTATQPSVTITNNVGTPAAPAAPQVAANAGTVGKPAPGQAAAVITPAKVISPSAATPKPTALGLTGIFDLSQPKLTPEMSAEIARQKAAKATVDAKNVIRKSRGQPLLPVPDIIAFDSSKIPLNSADVAAALQGKFAGVTELVAIGPTAILYTIDPSKASSAPPKTVGTDTLAQARAIEDELVTAFDTLPRDEITPDVLNLPDGYQGACAIITMVGHQVLGIVSLAALSDSRILVGYEKNVADSPLENLKGLVGKLGVSTIPPAPKVQSVTMRLYYDRDAVSVAAAVQAAFSQLKVQSVSMNPSFTYRDTIVIADPTGTSSTNALDEARRMIAQLDEPRAQVVVNAWSLQISRDEKDKGNELVPQARRLASGYNDALEGAIQRGWQQVNKLDGKQFAIALDPTFASYLCSAYTYIGANTAKAALQQEGLCANPVNLSYALGYTSLFGQEAPDLVQMMILVMAAKKPVEAITSTINAMEGRNDGRYSMKLPQPDGNAAGSVSSSNLAECSCQDLDKAYYKAQAEYLKTIAPICITACEGGQKLLGSAFYKNAKEQIAPAYLGFYCTRQKLAGLTAGPGTTQASSFVGQFRAAVADYLFQNKMKNEYPNDFDSFLFPASAATLDAALTPVVEAFDEDLQAFQQNLQRQLTDGIPQDKHLSFNSSGLISVKVVSGNQASAATTSLNYFPQNPTVSLDSLATNLASGQSATPTIPLLAGSLSSVIATTALYAAAQPKQVTAKVGNGLSLTVTPFTLSSAKGAELNVNVTYNENAAATISSDGVDSTQASGADDLNSRVSGHTVSTLVRMDSLKFFEISTMQSVIARHRPPWKPFDPIFELPLLDNPGIVIARRKPEVNYNQSIIFMEASIMPTAADLGQGLIYRQDKIAANACLDHKMIVIQSTEKSAHSAEDFCFYDKTKPSYLQKIIDYHKGMVAYFGAQFLSADGTVMPSAYQLLPELDMDADAQR